MDGKQPTPTPPTAPGPGAVRAGQGQERVRPQSWLLLLVVVPCWRWSPREGAAASAGQWELWLSRVVVVDVADGDCTSASCVYRRMRHARNRLGPD